MYVCVCTCLCIHTHKFAHQFTKFGMHMYHDQKQKSVRGLKPSVQQEVRHIQQHTISHLHQISHTCRGCCPEYVYASILCHIHSATHCTQEGTLISINHTSYMHLHDQNSVCICIMTRCTKYLWTRTLHPAGSQLF